MQYIPKVCRLNLGVFLVGNYDFVIFMDEIKLMSCIGGNIFEIRVFLREIKIFK